MDIKGWPKLHTRISQSDTNQFKIHYSKIFSKSHCTVQYHQANFNLEKKQHSVYCHEIEVVVIEILNGI